MAKRDSLESAANAEIAGAKGPPYSVTIQQIIDGPPRADYARNADFIVYGTSTNVTYTSVRGTLAGPATYPVVATAAPVDSGFDWQLTWPAGMIVPTGIYILTAYVIASQAKHVMIVNFV